MKNDFLFTEFFKEDKKCNDIRRVIHFLRFFRLGQYYRRNGNKVYERICRIICTLYLNYNNQFPFEANIGKGLIIPHLTGIIITGGANIGSHCKIFQQVTIGDDEVGNSPTIGNNCIIGAGAKIIGKCSIGDNVKIGANAVITKDVPSYCTVVGSNRIISKR